MNLIRRLIVRGGDAEPTQPWSVASALLTIAFAFAALIFGSALALVWLGERDYTPLAGLILGGILITLFVWQTHRSDLGALRLFPSTTPILFIMFIALGFAIGLDLIGLAVTREFLPKPELLGLSPGALGAAQWLVASAFLVVVQPIAEGLVFRGVALPAIRTLLGAWGGLLATAVIVGVFHMLIYPPNYNTTSALTPLWYGLLVPVLEAIFFSLVRANTGSTRVSIAAHAAFGLFAVLKLLTLAGGA
ncbi:MAG: type II CAAX endopeptidase family protein [Chloroflexota bacterium]